VCVCGKSVLQSNDSFVGTQQALRRKFDLSPRAPVPSRGTIDLWVKNFEITARTILKRGGSEKTSRTPENVERVRQAVRRSPQK